MNWPTVQLEHIARISGGSTPRRERDEFWGGTIPWLTPTDLPMPGAGIADVTQTASYITEQGLDSCAATLLPIDTVLFSSRATIGKVGIARVPLATNQGFANFIPGKAAESKYLAYCLQHYTDQIARLAGSTTFKEVTKSALKRFEIPLPALSEQRRIVEMLDQADALRQQRCVADEKVQRIVHALFASVFGDPTTNPHNWPDAKVGDVILETQYGTSTRASENGNGIAVIRMNNIEATGGLDLSSLKYVELSAADESKYRLQPGDLLFNRTNSRELVGKTALWSAEMPAVAASYLIRVRVDRDKVLPDYVWAHLNCPYIKQLLFNKARRAIGMANINAKELRALPIMVPDLPVQHAFVSRLELVRSLERRMRVSGQGINRLFDVLLHRAFTGELTAGWREAHEDQLEAEMQEQMAALEQARAAKPQRQRTKRGVRAAGGRR